MCRFKALCAVKYDGGYERAKKKGKKKGSERASTRKRESASTRFLVLSSL